MNNYLYGLVLVVLRKRENITNTSDASKFSRLIFLAGLNLALILWYISTIQFVFVSQVLIHKSSLLTPKIYFNIFQLFSS